MFAALAGFDRDNLVFGRICLAALAAAFAAADISPESARFVSFAAGIVAVVSTFALGSELWGTSMTGCSVGSRAWRSTRR